MCVCDHGSVPCQFLKVNVKVYMHIDVYMCVVMLCLTCSLPRIQLSVYTVQMSAVSVEAQLAAERKETDKDGRSKKILISTVTGVTELLILPDVSEEEEISSTASAPCLMITFCVHHTSYVINNLDTLLF